MFTNNLIDSRNDPVEARRLAVLPLVAGAHAALAAALVLASVWSLRYVTEPPIPYVPSIQVRLVPPPGGGGPRHEAGAERPKPDPAINVPPIIVPPTEPVIYSAAVEGPGDDGTGVDGGIGEWFGTGDGGGEAGGLPGSVAVPRPPVPDAGPLEIGGDVRAPVRLSPLTPAYPEAARKAGRMGTVSLRLTIDRQGAVTDVLVVSGLPFGLTQAAADAARRLRFKPAYRASTGQPVECYFDLSVEFRLN